MNYVISNLISIDSYIFYALKYSIDLSRFFCSKKLTSDDYYECLIFKLNPTT